MNQAVLTVSLPAGTSLPGGAVFPMSSVVDFPLWLPQGTSIDYSVTDVTRIKASRGCARTGEWYSRGSPDMDADYDAETGQSRKEEKCARTCVPHTIEMHSTFRVIVETWSHLTRHS
jgi:hypothetical protein